MHAEQLIRKLRAVSRYFFSRKHACKLEKINNVSVAYNPEHLIFIREYYLYCIEIFKEIFGEVGSSINVIFGEYAVEFHNPFKTIRIDFQWEHTLVRPGGRDSSGAVAGEIPLEDRNGHYLVRIQNREYLKTVDLIVDYSIPNIINVTKSRQFDEYTKKMLQISPLLYRPDFEQARGCREILTLFSDTRQLRRRRFLDEARQAGLAVTNVKGIYGRENLKRLYRRKAILINVHQTDDHRTFEELRVLPALLCGLIVISEDVPLRQQVPYHEFIIWSRYDNLIETARSVVDNYRDHHARIFNDPRLIDVLQRMQENNKKAVGTAIRTLLRE